MAFVSLQYLKQFMRVTNTADDDNNQIYLDMAFGSVIEYLGIDVAQTTYPAAAEGGRGDGVAQGQQVRDARRERRVARRHAAQVARLVQLRRSGRAASAAGGQGLGLVGAGLRRRGAPAQRAHARQRRARVAAQRQRRRGPPQRTP